MHHADNLETITRRVRRGDEMQIGSISDRGKVRELNEDSMCVYTEGLYPFFIVADGLGGHLAGEKASRMAIETIINILKDRRDFNCVDDMEDALRDAIVAANSSIYKYAKHDSSCKGMGTTVVVATIYKNTVLAAHVGDSRLYLIRESKIELITEDHTFYNELNKKCDIDIEKNYTEKYFGALTRAVGTDNKIEIDISKFIYREGDVILLCTDGLNKEVDDNDILYIVEKYSDTNEICLKLKDRAILNGGRDNITVIAVKL